MHARGRHRHIISASGQSRDFRVSIPLPPNKTDTANSSPKSNNAIPVDRIGGLYHAFWVCVQLHVSLISRTDFPPTRFNGSSPAPATDADKHTHPNTHTPCIHPMGAPRLVLMLLALAPLLARIAPAHGFVVVVVGGGGRASAAAAATSQVRPINHECPPPPFPAPLTPIVVYFLLTTGRRDKQEDGNSPAAAARQGGSRWRRSDHCCPHPGALGAPFLPALFDPP
jgi:hypothetical protein